MRYFAKKFESTGLPKDFAHRAGRTLDLGCGSRPRNPARARHVVGIDVGPRPTDLPKDIAYLRCTAGFEPLPLESDSIDVCTAYDFIEHVPRHALRGESQSHPFIELMNEIWRVLAPGGFFIGLTPAYPMEGAFVDPTHVNVITRDTVDYFAGPCHARQLGYGYEGQFEVVANTWIPYSSQVWKCQVGTASLESVDWTHELRTMNMRRHRNSAAQRRPKTHHLLWLLQKADSGSEGLLK